MAPSLTCSCKERFVGVKAREPQWELLLQEVKGTRPFAVELTAKEHPSSSRVVMLLPRPPPLCQRVARERLDTVTV